MHFDSDLTVLLGVSKKAAEIVNKAELRLEDSFKAQENIAVYNQAKVINAFADCNIQAWHFAGSNGYGYSDVSRVTLEALFAKALGFEQAIVRPQIVSGTHAIALSLFGLLMPGDTLYYITGRPYDTLEQTIGIEPAKGSLRARGVNYLQTDTKKDGSIDLDEVISNIQNNNSIKVVAIQRSSGYTNRRSLSPNEIEQAAAKIKAVKPDVFIFVDNCYGEFVQTKEPNQNVDVICGSLIKNLGGGLAPTGGYIAATQRAMEYIENALTAPGIGRECGSYEASYRPFFQGLFMAPGVTLAAVKTAMLFSSVFSEIGFECSPDYNQRRQDIIQSITLGSPDRLIRFCKCIQSASPIDGTASPEPSFMPGYTHKIIMAAGTFVQGASIELSADAPLKEPYTVYLQGALSYQHGYIACLKAVDEMIK